MGIAAAAFAAVAVLIAGAVAVAWLERRFPAVEAGPTAPVRLREEAIPEQPDSWLYAAAPVLALLGVAWAAAVIPFGPELIAANSGIGLFYYLVVVDFVVLALAAGGWGANTPDSVEAAYRAVAQLVAYVVPLGLAVIGPVMMARSLATLDIANAQREAGLPYIVAQPLGFALYLATAAMQTYRAPFIEPFADCIGGGVLGVYGGWKAMAWRLALSGLLFVVAAMGAVLFLGGYAGPLLPDPLWMLLKTAAVGSLILWIGRRFHLRSTAAMLELSWKYLIPAGLLNVLLVGGLILLGVGQAPFR